jgi:hypothetical protein
MSMELLTVLRIENNIALCHYLRNDDDSENSSQWDTIDLPLDLVNNLVALFGQYLDYFKCRV